MNKIYKWWLWSCEGGWVSNVALFEVFVCVCSSYIAHNMFTNYYLFSVCGQFFVGKSLVIACVVEVAGVWCCRCWLGPGSRGREGLP